MYDFSFQDQIKRETEARDMARRILGVREGASLQEIKNAWRKACKENHPDRNLGDQDAGRRFATIQSAYRLLAYGEPCDTLTEHSPDLPATPEDDKYKLNNTWGLFLWWRDRFFHGM